MKRLLCKLVLKYLAIYISILTINGFIIWVADKISYLDYFRYLFQHSAWTEEAVNNTNHFFPMIISGVILLWLLLYAVPQLVLNVFGESDKIKKFCD